MNLRVNIYIHLSLKYCKLFDKLSVGLSILFLNTLWKYRAVEMSPKGVGSLLVRRSNSSPPHHNPFLSRSYLWISHLKTTLTVILLLGVFYMGLGKRRGAKPTALQDVTDNSLHTVLKRRYYFLLKGQRNKSDLFNGVCVLKSHRKIWKSGSQI